MVLTLKTIKVSKKFGEVKFILFIALLLFGSIIYEITFIYLATFNFDNIIYFFFSHILYLISSILCIYLLVGSRIIYLMRHHQKRDISKNDNEYFDNIVNIVDFIPLKRGNNKNHILDYKYNEINKLSNNTLTNRSNKISHYYLNNIRNININNNNISSTNTNVNNNNFTFNSNNNSNNNDNINNNNGRFHNAQMDQYMNNYINGYNDYMKINNVNNSPNNSGDYIDLIDNNPNNYFFNQSLKMLSQKNN